MISVFVNLNQWAADRVDETLIVGVHALGRLTEMSRSWSEDAHDRADHLLDIMFERIAR